MWFNPIMRASLPIGKLPPDLLRSILAKTPIRDPRVRLGPGVGLDCAVIDMGASYLIAKTDPITFAADEIGWYAVHISANDIATTGARPRWFLATVLLPENQTTPELATAIFDQLQRGCEDVGASLVGGHTEITFDLSRPIVVGTMLGEVAKDGLIRPDGARVGDAVIVTKGVPIEGVAIIARERGEALTGRVEASFIDRARGFLHSPGISVLKDALLAAEAGGVTAMHDPTEGGLATGLWEMAEACGHGIRVEPKAIPIVPEGAALCAALGLDPMGAIASGALLICAAPESAPAILAALARGGIPSRVIGEVVEGDEVQEFRDQQWASLPRPERDEIAKLFQ